MSPHQTATAIAAIAHLTVITLLITTATSQTPPTGYTNHTVDWFFNATTNSSATNYSSWAASQSFYLGDFIVFKTTSNESVIQTYNETTYKSCSADDALDSDTFHYGSGSNAFDQSLTIPVPLTNEGPSYFFSDANDGVQCQQGMAFEIRVAHGLGLPPSLNQPPPPPYKDPPSPDSAQSPPVSIPAGGSQVPGNGGFNFNFGVSMHVVACAIFVAVTASLF